MSKELIEFRIALNKLVDDDNMPEVLDLINSETFRLLYRLQTRIFDGMMHAGNNVEYIWHNTRAVIQEEIKQYESKEELK